MSTRQLAHDLPTLLLGSALMLALTGYQFGESNHLVYLAGPLHRAYPALLANDWFTTQTLQYHGLFTLLSAALIKVNLIAPAFVVLYGALVVATQYAWLSMVRSLGGNVREYLLSVALWQLLAAGTALGSYTLLQDAAFLPSNVASVAMFCGLAFLLRERFIAAGIALAIAAAFHLNYAVIAPVVLVAACWPLRNALGLKRALTGFAIVCAVSAINIAIALVSQTHGTPLPLGDFVDLYVRLRHPHHYNPASWHWALWTAFLIPTAAAGWLIAHGRLGGGSQSPTATRVLTWVWSLLLALQLIAFLFAGLRFVSETLVQMSLFRFSVFVQIFNCVVIVIAACGSPWAANFATRIALPAAGLFLIVLAMTAPAFLNYGASQTVTTIRPAIACFAFALVAAGLFLTRQHLSAVRWITALLCGGLCVLAVTGRTRIILSPGDDLAYRQTCDWVAKLDHTDPSAIFLVPPDEQSMRVHGRRAIVVNFKAVPQLSYELTEWRRRIEDVSGIASVMSLPRSMPKTLAALHAAYAQLTSAQLRNIARQYGARYVVTVNAHDDVGRRIYAHSSGRYFVYDLAK